MDYITSYLKLKEAFSTGTTRFDLGKEEICRLEFCSDSNAILPGVSQYHCVYHHLDLATDNTFFNEIGSIEESIHVQDIQVEENRRFNYYILKPKDGQKAKKILFLVHGFNEKNWDKYLPWGQALCERTRSAIIFFPVAFHMQRAPLQWSDKRKMFELSEKRKAKFPNIIHSTLSNAAISMRLQYMPQRFIWSGLQTYYDVIQFMEQCKSGRNEMINRDFTSGFFAYSVGGLLSEILKLTNYKGYFDDSRICLFCSGAVFNRLSPVSKYILDSEANVALYSYLVEHFDSFLKHDHYLHHYIEEDHPEGKVFHSMLDYQKMRDFRESLFRKSEKDFYAIALRQDTVIPPVEIINTLQGAYRDIRIRVEELDFDHHYNHENPFPFNVKENKLIDKNFNQVFDKAAEFLMNAGS